jgi:hypothetical protein
MSPDCICGRLRCTLVVQARVYAMALYAALHCLDKYEVGLYIHYNASLLCRAVDEQALGLLIGLTMGKRLMEDACTGIHACAGYAPLLRRHWASLRSASDCVARMMRAASHGHIGRAH